MNNGNVRLATEGQLDELRLAIERSLNKLRGRIDFDTAQGLIFDSKPIDLLLEQLLPVEGKEKPIAQAVSTLFAPVGTITLKATTEKFAAARKFVVNTKDDAEVKIFALGDNFCDYFLGVTEDAMSGSELAVQNLTKFAKDRRIITDLGDTSKAKIALSQMFYALAQQGHGQEGSLLVNSGWNLFYIPQPVTKVDAKNFTYINRKGTTVKEKIGDPKYMFEIAGQWFVLRAVDSRWRGGGWYCGAYPVERVGGWGDGNRVVSRKVTV